MKDKSKQKKYLTERAKGNTQSKSAKIAGISKRTAVRTEKDPIVRTRMQIAFEKNGGNADKIAVTVIRNLDAQKVISANVMAGNDMKDAGSMTKDFIEVPDCMAQLKAAELAGKFCGDFVEKAELKVTGGVVLITNVKD